MNIVVTGGCGYLGSTLALALSMDRKVSVVDDVSLGQWDCLPLLLSQGCDFHLCDVTSPACRRLVQKANVVIHLAALVGAPLCEQNSERAIEVNETATRNLVRWLSPRQRLVFATTNSGYGSRPGGQLATEHDPLTPISVYGITKARAEEYVLEHPRSTCLRLATVFGVSPRMRFDLLVNDLTEKMSDHLHMDRPLPKLYEPDAVRNAVHVEDVASAFSHVVNRDLYGVYNVANPDLNLTKMQLARRIACRLGIDPDKIAEGEGLDPDRRDVGVSSRKLMDTNFRYHGHLEEAIDTIHELCRQTPRMVRQQWRNA